MIKRLEAAGIDLASVTDVVLTHMHFDHVGGLLVDGVKDRLRPDLRIHVAAAELLGVPTKPYHQKVYVTCLDLGEAGALFTRGWERKVEMVGDVAKKTKQEINTVWIYPPKAERAAALASADPERVTNL